MLRRRLQRPSHPTVVAYLALFVALGGTSAYAANTVFSTDIVDGEVKSVDVGNGEILSADVKDQSLTTFDVSTFLGADVVDGTLTAADLADDSVGFAEIQANSIFGGQVEDHSLSASDISEVTARNFAANIGVVPAQSCVFRERNTGRDISGDHLLLTPNSGNANPNLSYTAEYRPVDATQFANLKVCNPTGSAIDDGTTNFNLLAISPF